MPDLTKTHIYDDKVLVGVKPYDGAPFLYGFETNVAGAMGTAAKHEDLSDPSSLSLPYIVGAEYPKPGRLEGTTGDFEGVTTYADVTVIKTPPAKYKRVSKPRTRERPVETKRSTPCFVEIENPLGPAGKTFKYFFRISKKRMPKIEPHLSKLGIKVVDDTNYEHLAYGVNFPKPNHAQRIELNNGKQDTITAFVSTEAAEKIAKGEVAGWSLVATVEKVTLPLG